MPRRFMNQQPWRSWPPLAGAAVALLIVAAVVVAVTWENEPAAAPQAGDPGVVHVHGLDVDEDDGTLYAATHTGLFRISEGVAQRVGQRYHDLMGFTVVGPDDLVASGHPDLRDESLQRLDSPPLLGLVSSPDGGQTWSPLSLLGKTDFHALEAAHGRIYGWDATSGRFMVSADRVSWDTRSSIQLLDFAVDPADPDRIVAGTPEGTVASADGGRTWRRAGDQPVAVLAWSDSDLIAASPEGTVLTRTRNDGEWETLGDLGGQPESLHAEGTIVYASVVDRGILASRDGGRTWTVYYAPR